MKFPKNKETVYIVVRYNHGFHTNERVNIGVFAQAQEADNFAGACTQEMTDKGREGFEFRVEANTFYG